jgi:pSer/pThr/pTyr-binding forkhead associated (FHA) protein
MTEMAGDWSSFLVLVIRPFVIRIRFVIRHSSFVITRISLLDCVIKIIKGPDEGQEFRCSGTEAVIGRSPRSQVRLTSPAVSFEHAIISRVGSDFYIENLSAAGTYINDERIISRVRLRARDQLRFSADTVGRVAEVPTTSAGGRRRILLAAVVSLLVILVILALANPFAATAAPTSYRVAYEKLEAWAQRETDNHDLDPATLPLLREAWRLQMSGDTEHAAQLWINLQILLANQEPKLGFGAAAKRSDNQAALQHLAAVNPKIPYQPTDEEMGAALVQFVNQQVRKANGK